MNPIDELESYKQTPDTSSYIKVGEWVRYKAALRLLALSMGDAAKLEGENIAFRKEIVRLHDDDCNCMICQESRRG